MRRRTRAISGILALVAMTFSFAEAVMASSCVHGEGMDMMHAPESDTREHASMSADVEDRPGQAGGEGDRPHQCPFSPLAAVQGCTVVPSLPGQGVGGPADLPARERALFVVRSEHDLLMAQVLFHPPRA